MLRTRGGSGSALSDLSQGKRTTTRTEGVFAGMMVKAKIARATDHSSDCSSRYVFSRRHGQGLCTRAPRVRCRTLPAPRVRGSRFGDGG